MTLFIATPTINWAQTTKRGGRISWPAQSGHSNHAYECPLSGVKRTCRLRCRSRKTEICRGIVAGGSYAHSIKLARDTFVVSYVKGGTVCSRIARCHEVANRRHALRASTATRLPISQTTSAFAQCWNVSSTVTTITVAGSLPLTAKRVQYHPAKSVRARSPDRSHSRRARRKSVQYAGPQ